MNLNGIPEHQGRHLLEMASILGSLLAVQSFLCEIAELELKFLSKKISLCQKAIFCCQIFTQKSYVTTTIRIYILPSTSTRIYLAATIWLNMVTKRDKKNNIVFILQVDLLTTQAACYNFLVLGDEMLFCELHFSNYL